MKLRWRETYNTGINKIDEQHKHLFYLLIKVMEAPMHEKGLLLINNFEDLIKYAEYHFTEEEKYWITIKLPDDMVSKHRKEHKKYVNELNDIINNTFHQGLVMSMNTTDFLKNWIIDHILGEDQEFVEFARKKHGERSNDI